MQRILEMDELPKIMGVHVLGLGSADLDFRHGDEHLVADNLHFRRGALGGDAHELFALTEPLFAEEDDGALEDEAHGVELESLFDFTEEIGNVEPLDAAVVEELGRAQIDGLLAGLLVLPEEVVKDGAVLFVDPLHLVDVLGHLLHALEGVDKVLILGAVGVGQVAQLLQQERVLEDPLDRLNQVGLECGRVLLTRIAGLQKLLQGLRSFV